MKQDNPNKRKMNIQMPPIKIESEQMMSVHKKLKPNTTRACTSIKKANKDPQRNQEFEELHQELTFKPTELQMYTERQRGAQTSKNYERSSKIPKGYQS